MNKYILSMPYLWLTVQWFFEPESFQMLIHKCNFQCHLLSLHKLKAYLSFWRCFVATFSVYTPFRCGEKDRESQWWCKNAIPDSSAYNFLLDDMFTNEGSLIDCSTMNKVKLQKWHRFDNRSGFSFECCPGKWMPVVHVNHFYFLFIFFIFILMKWCYHYIEIAENYVTQNFLSLSDGSAR